MFFTFIDLLTDTVVYMTVCFMCTGYFLFACTVYHFCNCIMLIEKVSNFIHLKEKKYISFVDKTFPNTVFLSTEYFKKCSYRFELPQTRTALDSLDNFVVPMKIKLQV